MTLPHLQELANWAALATGMVLSFLYSGSETGAYVVNKMRLDLRAEAGQRSARRLASVLREPGVVLNVVLIGNNLANYIASAGIVLLLTQYGWNHPQWWAVAILTPILVVFCEMLPKNLFQRHGETLAYAVSGFLLLSRRVYGWVGLVPLTRGLTALMLKLAGRKLKPTEDPLGSRARLASILAEGQASGVLTHAQSIMADRVINLGRLRMRDVMVPLERAALAEEGVTPDQFRQLLRERGHARYGVYAGRRDNVIGVLSVYDVLLDLDQAAPATRMTTPLMLKDSYGVIEALVQLQKRHESIGFVVDDPGRCVGLVTVKDLVEEIVGELQDW